MEALQPSAKTSCKATNDYCPQTMFLYGAYKEDGTPNFGLFCWLSYFWDGELGVMASIGGGKLTKDRIHAAGVFSANLVTEALLPFADYCGNKSGYDADKMSIPAAVTKGAVLPVPVLENSPVTLELEVFRTVELDGGEILLCKIRNVLMRPELTGEAQTPEQRLREIAPVRTTCATYFSWDGRAMGQWGEPRQSITP